MHRMHKFDFAQALCLKMFKRVQQNALNLTMRQDVEKPSCLMTRREKTSLASALTFPHKCGQLLKATYLKANVARLIRVRVNMVPSTANRQGKRKILHIPNEP